MAGNGARLVSLPAPVGGWDTRNALADMPKENAIILDNWFPSTDKVTLRGGNVKHATGLSGVTETLITHTDWAGAAQMFAANGGAIYAVTTAGPTGAAVISGLSNNQWQQVHMGVAGGQYTLIFNGQDTPRTFDGVTWANASITGPTVVNLIWGNTYQDRLWVGEKDSLDAWFLGVGLIGGAASKLSLRGIARKGGYIIGMETWNRDNGYGGGDDVAVFYTSEGEAIVYRGQYPGHSTWGLVGIYPVGNPIGRRCMIRAGGELLFLTEGGVIPASVGLQTDTSQNDKVAYTAQISQAFSDSARDYGALFGWQPFIYPKGAMLMFNVPQSGLTAHQYVFNTITGKPCRFTGLNAFCWALMGDNAYFGGADGAVYKFDTGSSDNGVNIRSDALQAFWNGGTVATKSNFHVEPIFESNGDPESALDMNIDYQIKHPIGVSGKTQTTAGKWGIAKWGQSIWGTSRQIFRVWRPLLGRGKTFALRVRVDTKTVQPSWIATNFRFKAGGIK